MSVKMGDKIRDRVSGIEGLATGVTHYLNGCEQWLVSLGTDKDGKHQSGIWYDVQQLEVVDKDPKGLGKEFYQKPESVRQLAMTSTRSSKPGGPPSSARRS